MAEHYPHVNVYHHQAQRQAAQATKKMFYF